MGMGEWMASVSRRAVDHIIWQAKRNAANRTSYVAEGLERRIHLDSTPIGYAVAPHLPALEADEVTPLVGTATPTGLTPANMRSAYGINAISFGGVSGTGAGQTIALVDAYNDPNITSDLASFDSYFGIAAPPSFTVESQTGSTTSLPAANSGWITEEALDVEWSHVIAPSANIILVEANSNSYSDLFTAVNWARNLPGVSVVSMSWSGG